MTSLPNRFAFTNPETSASRARPSSHATKSAMDFRNNVFYFERRSVNLAEVIAETWRP
jgi:hypothetical protein